MAKQTTIAAEISLKGVGLHTGQEVAMTFKPAPVNNGFTFVRVDLEGQPIIEADANYVVNTQRGTNLEKLGVYLSSNKVNLVDEDSLDFPLSIYNIHQGMITVIKNLFK